jgi:hypothetical protein
MPVDDGRNNDQWNNGTMERAIAIFGDINISRGGDLLACLCFPFVICLLIFECLLIVLKNICFYFCQYEIGPMSIGARRHKNLQCLKRRILMAKCRLSVSVFYSCKNVSYRQRAMLKRIISAVLGRRSTADHEKTCNSTCWPAELRRRT